MLSVYSGRDRSRSVSSILSKKRPPWWRANSQLNTAVRAVPMCRVPVGLGANRTLTESGWTTLLSSVIDDLFEDGTDGARTRNFRRDRAVL